MKLKTDLPQNQNVSKFIEIIEKFLEGFAIKLLTQEDKNMLNKKLEGVKKIIDNNISNLESIQDAIRNKLDREKQNLTKTYNELFNLDKQIEEYDSTNKKYSSYNQSDFNSLIQTESKLKTELKTIDTSILNIQNGNEETTKLLKNEKATEETIEEIQTKITSQKDKINLKEIETQIKNIKTKLEKNETKIEILANIYVKNQATGGGLAKKTRKVKKSIKLSR